MNSGTLLRRLAGWLAAVGLLAGSLLLAPLSSAPAHADGLSNKISRSEVIARAHYWLSKNVPYSQSANYPDPEGRNYRTDCSGFVSMAWHLDQSRTTATLDDVATRIDKDDLKPGDILLRRDDSVQHVVLFEAWTSGHSKANIIAEANTADDMNYYQDASISTWSSYTAYRYKKIFDDSYDAANEQAPPSKDGAKCATSKPDDATIDLGGRRDVYIEAETCVKRQNLDGTKDRFHAWITLKWGPGKDSDDSSNTATKRFDGFMVHTQLQFGNETQKEVRCYFDNNINASISGTRACHISVDSTKEEEWSADGYLNWNADGDGKYWLKPWYAQGVNV